ncbi:Fur family transcriptional regulator [Elusimicrobiota bacterium]
MNKETDILNQYLLKQNLRHSSQRETILRVFLSIEKHVTAEKLYDALKSKHPGIGIATVHRNLKLFSQCGLAREVRLGDKKTYYEHSCDHTHHDHLICTKCNNTIEFLDPTIEKLQEQAAKKYGFRIEKHSLEIYGICKKCKN